MTQQQRDALRRDILRWIDSDEFPEYMRSVHLHRSDLPRSLWSLFFSSQLWPWQIAYRSWQIGFVSPHLHEQYRKLATTGKISRGYISKTLGIGLQRNEYVRVLAGVLGTDDNDEMAEACMKMQDVFQLRGHKPDPYSGFLGALSKPLAAGKSSYDFSSTGLLYVFNAQLHRSVTPSREKHPSILCLVNPDCWPSILPIPFNIAKHYDSRAQDNQAETSDLATADDELPSQSMVWDFLETRIKCERRGYYDSLDMLELSELKVRLNFTLKTGELDAIIAARTGDFPKLSNLLSSGVSPDTVGLVKLHMGEHHLELLKFLMDRGANPNKPMDGTGHTYLHEAALGNQKAIVELLLARGADPNLKTTDGLTALYYAREQPVERAEIIEILKRVTRPGRVSYVLDDFLKIENPTDAFYFLSDAIRKDLKNRECLPIELKILGLDKFMDYSWYNGFDHIYNFGRWAVIPCAELFDVIEPVYADIMWRCIKIVRDAGERAGRDPFSASSEFVPLDDQAEAQLVNKEFDFLDRLPLEPKTLCARTMEYVRANQHLFTL